MEQKRLHYPLLGKCFDNSPDCRNFLEFSAPARTLRTVTELPVQNPEWASFCQLVQQLIAGNVRRNVFTQREMGLLLDLEMSYMRKSSRPEMLRRYLKAVQRQHATGALEPLRFSCFFENETQSRKPSNVTEPEIVLLRAS